MRGRPRRKRDGERTTSVALDVFAQEAILQLQIRRLRATDRKPTLRELVAEGINALLIQEGLEPVRPAAPEPHVPAVVSITKKYS